MRITLISLGKFKKNSVHRALFEEYADRLQWMFDLKELAVKSPSANVSTRQEQEAALIMEALPTESIVFALDERGGDISSSTFSKLLEKHINAGNSHVTFIIGGADGLHESVREKAKHLMAFGKTTWPHMMVRGMLAEQLYRAQQTLKGHPYHKE